MAASPGTFADGKAMVAASAAAAAVTIPSSLKPASTTEPRHGLCLRGPPPPPLERFRAASRWRASWVSQNSSATCKATGPRQAKPCVATCINLLSKLRASARRSHNELVLMLSLDGKEASTAPSCSIRHASGHPKHRSATVVQLVLWREKWSLQKDASVYGVVRAAVLRLLKLQQSRAGVPGGASKTRRTGP